MKKQHLAVALALALGIATVASRADEPAGGHDGAAPAEAMHGPMGGGPERLLKQLDLSADQKEQLKAMRRARRDKNDARRHKLEDAQEDLHDMLAKTDRSQGYADKLKAKHEELLLLQQEAGRDRFESILEIRAILTDAQLKKFLSLEEERGGKMMGGRRGRGKGDRG